MNEDVQSLTETKGFSKLREIFWPIHGNELKKFLPMGILMSCILFVYAMVRNLKDTFIMHYAVCGGTELIFILKPLFVMPAAFLSVMLFTFFVNKFGSRRTFYIMISLFVAFYTVFLFLIFPNIRSLQPGYTTVRHLQNILPSFLYYVIPCITNWCYTLFYVVSEIWSTIVLQSLFWQFANRITNKNETKRFYPLYALVSSLGGICSGGVLSTMAKAGGTEFDKNVRILITFCIFFAFATMALFHYINRVIAPDPKLCDQEQFRLPSKKMGKGKIDILEGIKMLFSVPYIGLMAIMVFAHGISDTLLETSWKDQLRIAYPNANEYAAMMGKQTILVGTFTIILTWASIYLLQKTTWKISALVCPVIMATFGLAFFVVALLPKMYKGVIDISTFNTIAAWIGLVVVAFVRSTKNCLFDSIKNMAYRPLDVDTKTKGQAAVEVIGGRSGKTGAALMNTFLTSIVDSGSKISSHMSTILAVFLIMVVGWIFSVFKLSKKYEVLSSEIKPKETLLDSAKVG